jgi:hypothetical protein
MLFNEGHQQAARKETEGLRCVTIQRSQFFEVRTLVIGIILAALMIQRVLIPQEVQLKIPANKTLIMNRMPMPCSPNQVNTFPRHLSHLVEANLTTMMP